MKTIAAAMLILVAGIVIGAGVQYRTDRSLVAEAQYAQYQAQGMEDECRSMLAPTLTSR